MSIARKWVFPILGLVIAAAIAVALVKLAFFGASTSGAAGEEPTGGFVDPQVPVMIATVSNDVVLSGTVKADDAVPVKAPLDGTLVSVDVGVGSVVGAGQQLGVVKGVNSSGRAISVPITAPVGGTVSALSNWAARAACRARTSPTPGSTVSALQIGHTAVVSSWTQATTSWGLKLPRHE